MVEVLYNICVVVAAILIAAAWCKIRKGKGKWYL